MGNTANTRSFLEAIEKFASQQREQIHQEIEDYRREQLKKAKKSAVKDAKALIASELVKEKAEIASVLVQKEAESRKKLYLLRQDMIAQIMSEVEDKLISFTNSDEYSEFLKNSLEKIKCACNDSFEIYAKSCDVEKIKALAADLDVLADDSIKLGGIKGFCKQKAIICDDTLDSRLKEQRAYLIKNCNLKVV